MTPDDIFRRLAQKYALDTPGAKIPAGDERDAAAWLLVELEAAPGVTREQARQALELVAMHCAQPYSTDDIADWIADWKTPAAGEQAEDEPTRFPLYSFDDIINRPTPRWLVEGLIPEDALVVLYGAPGAFKSFLALDFALSVALGRAWHGLAVGPARPAIYIAAEGAGGLSKRLRAWAWDRKIEGGVPFLRVVDRPVAAGDPGELARFIDAVSREAETLASSPALFAFDTMARCMPGRDENSSADVGAFIDGVDKLRRRFGATAMLTHHADKQGRYERGSSALRGAVDVLLRVTREGKKPPVAILTSEKTKDAEDAADRKIELRLCMYGNGQQDNSLVINTVEIVPRGGEGCYIGATPSDVARTLDLLRCYIADGQGSYSRWRKVAGDMLGLTEGAFGRHVKVLIERGYAAKGAGRLAPYVITAKGMELLDLE